jgi:hypothetical protein
MVSVPFPNARRAPQSPSRDPEVWTREQAIGRLRDGLLRLSDGEHSMCQVAAELGIFCRGFRRLPDGEFLRRWSRVLGASTHLTRAQMERFADLWQLTEQLRLRVPLACDAATITGGACRGWKGFTNADLEICCDEILGRNVIVEEESVANRSNRSNRSHPRRWGMRTT